jgi:hypothetical protein
MGFPPGVPISIGAVEACGDGLHAFLLGPDGGGATRCVCGRLQYTGFVRITGAPGQPVVILSPDRIHDERKTR